MYSIRNAVEEDVFWLVKQAHLFCSEYGLKKYTFFNMDTMVPLFFNSIKEECILMCEKDGTTVGTIGGAFSPHFFNPALLVFAEIFWYIAEEHRTGKPALLLFKSFIELGKEKKAHLITMSKLIDSGVKDEFFERKGFMLLEKSFVLEI